MPKHLLPHDVTPEDRMRGCVWASTFRSAADEVEKYGTLFGAPVVDRGITLNGTTQYVIYRLNGELNTAQLTFHCEFYPTFATSENVDRYLFQTTLAAEYSLRKRNNAAANVLSLMLGNTLIADIPEATYGPLWVVGSRNLITISGTTGATNAWLNGTQILTANATAWAAKNPATLAVGATVAGASFFDGIIKRLYIGAHTSTLGEHLAYWTNTMWNWNNRATMQLQMRTLDYDPTSKRTLDSSGHGNHFTLGDGVTPTTYPTQGKGRMVFDGGDYLDGGDDVDLDFTVTGSLACCFKLSAYTNYTVLMCKQIFNTSRRGYSLFLNNVGGYARGAVCSAVGATSITGTSNVTSGVHTAVFAWDGSFLRLWVDGRLENTVAQTVNAAPSGSRARVGRPSDSASFMFTGEMYDTKGFSFAVNATQVADYHRKMISRIGAEL